MTNQLDRGDSLGSFTLVRDGVIGSQTQQPTKCMEGPA
jgi:hypothetical protein